MRETMRDAPGVGLAAPQVGLDLQLAVIEDKPEYTKGAPANFLKEPRPETGTLSRDHQSDGPFVAG